MKPLSRTNRSERQFCNNQCYHAWDAAYKATDEMRAKTAQRIADGAFGSTSKIEERVAEWMEQQGLTFEPQVRMWFRTVDFQVGAVVVEVNGCYWHGCPEHFPDPTPAQRQRQGRDAGLKTYCARHGLALITIWEHDIRAGDSSALLPLLDGTHAASSLATINGAQRVA